MAKGVERSGEMLPSLQSRWPLLKSSARHEAAGKMPWQGPKDNEELAKGGFGYGEP